MKLTISMFLISGLLSCGNNDMLNSAKMHGQKMGDKNCECLKTNPENIAKCRNELSIINKNYKAFSEIAKESGSDMVKLHAIHKKTYQKALSSCK